MPAAPPAPARILALATAGGATAALGLAGVPVPVAAGLAAAWTLAAWPALGWPAAAALAPAGAVLIHPEAWSIAGWTLAGGGCAALASMALAMGRNQAEDGESLLEAERELLRGTIQRYPILLEACLELSSVRDADRFAETLCTHARTLLPEARCIRVFLGSGLQISCRAGFAADPDLAERPDPGDEERYVAQEYRPLTRRSGMVIRAWQPLRSDRRRDGADDGLRGVLMAELEIPEAGGRIALDLLAALSRLGGLGLAAVDLVDQARALALHDDLTGLYGQQEFLRRLDEHVAAARRQQETLGVIMCDLDHLKRFNDAWGHAAGDAALRAVAGALKNTLPPEGLCCRYGGEEFAALVPGIDGPGLAALAERIRTAIAGAAQDGSPGRLVTASLGIVLVRPGEAGRAALHRADAACYRAKAGGRNRVVADREEATP